MKKEYSLGFLFNSLRTEVVLIKKKRPSWQSGLLNGVGGKLEEIESPLDSMIREFWEETSVVVSQWNDVLTLEFPAARVFVFSHTSQDRFDRCKTMTDEEIVKMDVDKLSHFDRMNNIDYLIPLCIDREIVNEFSKN